MKTKSQKETKKNEKPSASVTGDEADSQTEF